MASLMGRKAAEVEGLVAELRDVEDGGKGAGLVGDLERMGRMFEEGAGRWGAKVKA